MWNDAWGYTNAGGNGSPAPWGSVYNPVSPMQTVRLAGWQCPGCNACYAPQVTRCPDCPQQQDVSLSADDECVPPEEGGTCAGGRHCAC